MTGRRFTELAARFGELAADIPDSPEKEALSVLHGMVQEAWREWHQTGQAAGPAAAEAGTFPDIANLYRTAPRMDGPAMNQGLAVGTRAPEFTLSDATNTPVSLSDFRGQPLVLVFYPLDWSPTCSDQLSLYQAELAEFERFGARVVALSVDSIYSHGAWAAVRGITFPLLADFEPRGEVARRYQAYRPADGFSERALYVIDAEGIIRYSYISPRLGQMPDIYELYQALSEITGIPAPTSSEAVASIPGGEQA
jgi:peroxiredoxin